MGSPTQWAGSKRAREFVTSLGFESTYAGFESADREAVLPVDGPLSLPKLHDFQRSISNDLRDLLTSKNGNRGLVSLPTGAGKTRVAVQTLVEAYMDGDVDGPILWVAQSDELCEQAVQSWREVWRSEGPEARMHINRLWGSNEVSAVGSGLQVVVATIQKLRERRERSDYAWLWQATCLVIDEAHRAITPEYTALLETFGMGRGKRGIPLIGLTATPFRGENERETQQLASRYGNRLLDVAALGDNPYAALQEMGVLAEVEHEILKGSEVDLTASERDYLEKFERMPSSVEGRLGVDADRNEILLESIGSLADDWTVLLFAASVEHAQIMAALLSLEGIPARAISAETETGARRHYVEEFRHARIRVLTNYNVLTQGFDAPAVRAVYVARPTFSTNLYQQMVGRGLRGPLNGGGDTCRIVNVADNFLKFGEQLAFHRFDYLWNRSA
jgi:superfamily II DNA or RNA helicase